MPRLTQEQFLSMFGDSRQRRDASHAAPFDFWPYFESIPAADFDGHDCSAGRVEYVWRMSPQTYEHVLVSSEDPNVFMVIVLDTRRRVVVGHRLLDLRREYGLQGG